MKKIALILAATAVFALIAGCGGDPSVIDDSTAIVICKNKVESVAKYDADMSLMSAETIDKSDHWLVRVPGKMQNGFGAWRKVAGYCRVAKRNPDPKIEFNPAAIIEFELQQ